MTRLFSLLLAILVAGCSNIAGLSNETSSGSQSWRPALAQLGGPFVGAYSGNENGGSLCALNEPFSFSGTGSATFIHGSSENGSVVWTREFTCNLTGFATLKSINHPKNSLIVYLHGQTQGCDPRGGFHFIVSSGTGKFAHATGQGTLQFVCQNGGGYTDKWTGTLML